MESNYNIKYKGQFEALDALTVFNSQIQFINILHEIAVIRYPEVGFAIKVKGFRKGSLNVQQILEIASGIFAADNFQYVKGIFQIFSELLKLKNFLKDKKAQSVKKIGNNSVRIVIKGKNITVSENAFNLYQNNPVLTNAFNATSEILTPQEKIKSIEVSAKRKNKRRENLLTIKRNDLKNFSTENPYLNKEYTEYTYPDQILLIKKPNLVPERGKKWYWHMIHKGRDIHARIEDPAFRRRINEGLKVGQGDRLRADLIVKYKYDGKFNTYLETNQFIVKNIREDIIQRDTQMKLNY
jgi:hypothetical protein